MSMFSKLTVNLAIALLTVVVTVPAHALPVATSALLATDSPDSRQERREDRRDDRGERDDNRQGCRDDEGAMGKDKRDCKQEERRDNDVEPADSQ